MGGDPPPLPFAENRERGRYDSNEKGEAAPETVLLSKSHFGRMMRWHFSDVRVNTENAISLPFLHRVPRYVWIGTIGRIAGVDLYARGRKQAC
jgi:hypothetical protein